MGLEVMMVQLHVDVKYFNHRNDSASHGPVWSGGGGLAGSLFMVITKRGE